MEKSEGFETLLLHGGLTGFTERRAIHLGVQVRRASVSVTANISEGYGRYYHRESIHFYRIARGSIYELKDHIMTCLDLNLIDSGLFDRGIILIENAKKTLNGYIKFLKQQGVNG